MPIAAGWHAGAEGSGYCGGSDVFDGLIVLHAIIKIDERCHPTRLNYCLADVVSGKRSDSFHGLPPCQHEEFDLLIEIPSTKMGTKKARQLAKLRHDVRPKVFWVGLGIGIGCASTPFANDHKCLDELLQNNLILQ